MKDYASCRGSYSEKLWKREKHLRMVIMMDGNDQCGACFLLLNSITPMLRPIYQTVMREGYGVSYLESTMLMITLHAYHLPGIVRRRWIRSLRKKKCRLYCLIIKSQGTSRCCIAFRPQTGRLQLSL
jgi:hypothetical protein